MTQPQLEIRRVKRSLQWFQHWIVDNLLRHTLAHLVGRHADESLLIKCLPGGYLDVDTFMAMTPATGSRLDLIAEATTLTIDLATAARRIVRVCSVAAGAYVANGDGVTTVYLGVGGPGHGLVARAEHRYLYVTNEEHVCNGFSVTQWWDLPE
jgi:hypothetical protein